METWWKRKPRRPRIRKITGRTKRSVTNSCSRTSTKSSASNSTTKDRLRVMRMPSKRVWEINSTSRRDHPKLSIFQLDRKVTRLIHPWCQTSPSKPPSGWSLTHTCRRTRISRDRSSKRQWKIRRTRSLSKFSSSMSRTLFTPQVWSDASRSWREWLFRTLMTRSLRITSTTRTIPWIVRAVTLGPCSHFGDFLPKNLERNMLRRSNGTQGIATCLP